MSKKTILIIFALIIFVSFLVLIFFLGLSKDSVKTNEFLIEEKNLMEVTSFEERESFVVDFLSNKFSVSQSLVSVFIARESERFINGAFIVESGENSFNGYFLAIVNNKMDIIWAEKELIDCSLLSLYDIPQEMAPHCF